MFFSAHINAASNSCTDIFNSKANESVKPKAKATPKSKAKAKAKPKAKAKAKAKAKPKAKAKAKAKAKPRAKAKDKSSQESKGLVQTINPHNTIFSPFKGYNRMSNEYVDLENGHKQFPPTPEIAINKAQVEIDVQYAINRVSVWVSKTQNLPLAIEHEGSSTGKVPGQNTIGNGNRALSSLNKKTDDEVVRMHALEMKLNGKMNLSHRDVEERVFQSRNNSAVVKAARDYFAEKYQGQLASAPEGTHLANYGDRQYIKFIPIGTQFEVHARILNIGLVNKDNALIFVEWINPALHDKLGTKRVRHIAYLKPAEIAYLRQLGSEEVHEVQTTFTESLTLRELETIKLAKDYNIKSVNFQPHTQLETESGYRLNEVGPLTLMTDIVHLGIQGTVERKWGKQSIAELYNAEEKETYTNHEGQTQFVGGNIIDIISRHTPMYVLWKFNDKDSDFKYAFVITLEGQLKLMPFSPRSASFYAPLLRLAHGRRIFVGGTFIMSPKGEVEVSFESMHYGNANGGFGNAAFGGTRSKELHAFISEAFRLHTGRMVTYIDSRRQQSESIYYRDYDQGKVDESLSRDWAKDLDFIHELMNDIKPIVWNTKDPNVGPLGFEDYVIATGDVIENHKDHNGKIIMSRRWANYVLNISEDTPQHEIKKAYRRLATRFHPDKNKNNPEVEVYFKMLGPAFEILLDK